MEMLYNRRLFECEKRRQSRHMSEFWLKVNKTLAYHGRRLLRGARAVRWGLMRPVMRRPVIIVGCSRAGTTLVYKAFSESAELGSLQRETHDFWAGLHPPAQRDWDSHIIPAACASDADRARVSRYFYLHGGKSRFVDKNNQNGLCIPYLHTLYPDAHFIYVKRSAGDNINSLIEGWGKADEFATWADDLPAEVKVEGGRYRRWCFFLAPGWREYLEAPVEQVAAFQYAAMNNAILDAKAQIPAQQWSEVFYEELVRDPVAGFKRVFLDAGLRFDPHLQTYCRDVLSTPFNAFSEIRLDKWKDGRNADKVARVLPELAPVEQRMGYAER